jgi:hypothetical protein
VTEFDRAAVQRRWVHAHEEDTESELVFRPASYQLPPSRGRSALDLRTDGTYVESSPGPTDRPEEAAGTWVFEGDRLTLRPHNGSTRVLRIASAEPDRLVVRRLPG